MPSRHPHITQRKQRHQLRRVFRQPFVANLDETELALDHPKRMLDLGTHAGFELLGFVQQATPARILVQRPAFTWTHGHVPVHCRGFWPLVRTLVTGIRKHHGLLTVQQPMALRDVVDVGRRSNDGVHQARVSIDTNVRFPM